MPIHVQGYRQFAGERVAHPRAWWVIARTGIVERLRERRFLALLLVAWLPFVMRTVQIYASFTFAQASFLTPDVSTYHQFLDQQRAFVFFVTIYAGSGLIAGDRRANALQLYLSKPMTRIDYVGGKLLILLLLLLSVSWLPAMMLVLLQVMFGGGLSLVTGDRLLIPAITLTCVVQTSVAAVTMLALSSLSRSGRFVGMLYAGLVFFSAAVVRVLRLVTGSAAWIWLSPRDLIAVLTDAMFGASTPPAVPVPAAAIGIALLIALSIGVLEKRVRAVEAVS